MIDELSLLIHDTILFFKQEGVSLPKQVPSQTKYSPVRDTITKERATSQPSKLPQEAPPLPKVIQKPIPEKNEKESWALHPMPQPTAMQPNFGRFLRSIAPSIPIVLILPEENASHRLFLENVARAITRQIAPARVILANEKIDASAKLILISKSLLQDSNVQLHQLYEKNGLTYLPLEELDGYLNDRNLKLSLWNTLKNFPSSRLSF